MIQTGVIEDKMNKLQALLLPLVTLAVSALCLLACSSDNIVNPVVPDSGDNPPTENLETPKDGRTVVAYAAYYSDRLLPNPKLVTHINYAFAEVYVEGTNYRKFEVRNRPLFARIKALKGENPKIKISLSFTHGAELDGHTNEGGFSALASSSDNRRRFAADCLDFCKREGIDGIDIDWEFPGVSWSGAKCDPAHDVENYTLLLQQLRETLGDAYLISFAGYVMDKQRTDDGEGWKFIDLKAAIPYVDFINVMTYDLDAAFTDGLWKRGFHSANTSHTSYWDIARTLREYERAGVPASKMVLGIPFYVRISFDAYPMIFDFNQLPALGSDYQVDNWDDESQTPFVTYQGKFYGSYDNAESIAIKGRKYIGGYGMKGMFYWESSEDDARYTLSRACWNAAMKSY